MKLKLKGSSKPQSDFTVLSQNVTEDKFEKVITYDSQDNGFDKLIAKAEDIQSKCTDIGNVDMGSLVLTDKLHLESYGEDPLDVNVSMTPYAFGQLCTKLGVPTQYMKKCIECGETPLVVDNISTWLENSAGKKLLIRKYGEVARGILSDKYSVCDTPEILSSIAESNMLNNMKLQGYVLNPNRFHARFIGTKMKVVGEDLFAGIQIDSSDVGRSKLDIKFLIYKKVCTNGLVLPQSAGKIFDQKHIGISSENMVATLKEAFSDFSFKVKNATTLIDKARDIKIENPLDLANSIKTGAKVGDDTVGKIFDVAGNHYDMTIWGIVNAITEVSQDYTLEHRILMERYAGVLLTQHLK